MSDAAQQASAKGGSKLVPLLLVVNSVLIAAVLGVFLLRGGGAQPEAAAAATGADPAHGAKDAFTLPGPTTKLADFVVHLRDADADRYARVSFEIEVGTEEDKAKLAAFMPRIRDGFIAYLSDRTLEELRGSEAIGRLKASLAERLTAMAPGVTIRGLFVTDLVVQ